MLKKREFIVCMYTYIHTYNNSWHKAYKSFYLFCVLYHTMVCFGIYSIICTHHICISAATFCCWSFWKKNLLHLCTVVCSDVTMNMLFHEYLARDTSLYYTVTMTTMKINVENICNYMCCSSMYIYVYEQDYWVAQFITKLPLSSPMNPIMAF